MLVLLAARSLPALLFTLIHPRRFIHLPSSPRVFSTATSSDCCAAERLHGRGDIVPAKPRPRGRNIPLGAVNPLSA
jgi:hypothetical protein